MNPTFSSMSWFLFCQGESCEGEGCQEEAKEDHESQTKKITLFVVVFCVSCVVGCVTIKFKFKLTGNYLVVLFVIQRLSGVALTMAALHCCHISKIAPPVPPGRLVFSQVRLD